MTRVLAKDEGGSVKLSEAALAQIVGRAVASVEGARLRRSRRRLGVEFADGRARVELAVAVEYGRVIPELARAVQASVGEALATACEVAVESVDVAIVELVP